MTALEILSALREIINDDPMSVLNEIKSEWEQQTAKKLYPAQSDNFVLNELAAREAKIGTQVINCMMQNYVKTATGVFLDALGEFWNCVRLTEITHDEDDNEITLVESDDRYRMRIILAPETITSCGTVGAYRYFVLSSDLSITDVDFGTPDDGSGRVHATILTENGIHTNELISTVFNTLTDEKNAVLCVTYSVSAPLKVYYKIDADITIYNNAIAVDVQKQVTDALISYTQNAQKTLGKDIVLSQILDVIHNVSGVYSAALKGFPVSGVIKILSGDEYPLEAVSKIAQWPVCTGITVNIAGAEHG